MWICFNNSFVSTVADLSDYDNLLVRARRRKDLTAVLPHGWAKEIVENRSRDYRFRVSIPRSVWARVVSNSVRDIDYGNFKDSVRDEELHKMYALWWGDHLELDPLKKRSRSKK